MLVGAREKLPEGSCLCRGDPKPFESTPATHGTTCAALALHVAVFKGNL